MAFTINDVSFADDSQLGAELGKQLAANRARIAASSTSATTDAAVTESGVTSVPSASDVAKEISASLNGLTTSSAVTSANASDKLAKLGQNTVQFRATLLSKQTSESVLFRVTPVIDESRAANYDHLSPVHHPGTIQVYKNTEARTFNVSGKFISRTSQEATDNLYYINLLRGWLMPYYGQGTANSYAGDKLGAPPDILEFDVYGERNISRLPVVLTSYHWVYPDNVDYIPTNDGLPFPTIMEVSLSLIEAYSPEQYTNFDITKYRTGNMTGAYDFSATPQVADSGSTTTSSTSTSMTDGQGGWA